MKFRIPSPDRFQFSFLWLLRHAGKWVSIPFHKNHRSIWQKFTTLVRAIRELWYLKGYNIQPLALMTPLVPPHGGLHPAEAAIRWIAAVQISEISKHSLFAPPPTQVTFRVTVPRRGRFRTFVALLPEVWDHRHGGVEFTVAISTPENRPSKVYRTKLHPASFFHRRRWKEICVNLYRFAGQQVNLTLATTVPYQSSAEHAGSVWGEPMLLSRKPFDEMRSEVKSFLTLYSLKEFAAESLRLLRGQIAYDNLQQGTSPARDEIPAQEEVGSVRKKIAVESTGLRHDWQKFAIYTNSSSNYFFQEIGDVLASGLKELGFVVKLRNAKDGFAKDVDWHIVIAPHEFFHIDHGMKLQHRGLPTNLILFNTEQPSTPWFVKAYRLFSRAHVVWDMNHSASEFIRSRGFPCSYLPLGYVPEFQPFEEVKELPRHYGTCFLAPEVSQRSYVNAPLAHRPIDILFVGYLSPRREKFFAEAASVLSKYHCYFYFWDATTPVVPGKNTYMDTRTAIGLAQRTKIILNIHHGENQYFEWHRVVMHGLWQKALVISEIGDVAPPFNAGRDFVAVPLSEIPLKIAFHLSSAEGRRQSQAIADCGFRTLTEECRLVDVLRERVEQLYVPASNMHLWQAGQTGNAQVKPLG